MNMSLTDTNGSPRTQLIIVHVPPRTRSYFSFRRAHLGRHRPFLLESTPILHDRPRHYNISFNDPPLFSFIKSKRRPHIITVWRRNPSNPQSVLQGGWSTQISFRLYRYIRSDDIPFYINHPTLYVYHGVHGEYVPYKTTNLHFMPNVTELQDDFCYACLNLSSVELPDNILAIGLGAFKDCVNLVHISLPPNLKTLRKFAFARCEKLRLIFIPSSLTYLGTNVFVGCNRLEVVIFEDDIKQQEESSIICNDAFAQCSSLFRPSTIHDKNHAEIQYHILIERYKNLPLHRICAKPAVSVSDIKRCIQNNREIINGSECDDHNGHSALHILVMFNSTSIQSDIFMCCFEICPSALLAQGNDGETPWNLIVSLGDIEILSSVISYIASNR